jgi:hypothetical protein
MPSEAGGGGGDGGSSVAAAARQVPGLFGCGFAAGLVTAAMLNPWDRALCEHHRDDNDDHDYDITFR